MPPFFSSSDDKDEDMGWPEWLKSLGAETIEPAGTETPEGEEQPSYSAWSDLQQSVSSSSASNSSPFANWLDVPQAAPAASPSDAPLANDPWSDLPEQEPASYSTWEEQIDAAMTEEEKAHLATLESVEKDLFSQGFVPLQPGALSTIAQESSFASSTSDSEQPIDTPVENWPASAPTQIDRQSAASPAPTEQPWWTSVPVQATTPEMPAPIPAEPAAVPVAQVQQEVPTAPLSLPAASEQIAVTVEPAPQQVPAPVLATSSVQQAVPLVPAYRADAQLENELETTMRRPAMRLQHMQAAGGVRPGTASLAAKGRSAERKPATGEGALSPKEQLVKGYQYQLAGAYDDAMQEYRITIRNAPELLDDVISNLRALLKLAPRYTAGYRVLGDAYMRQGQYLQAMEAYNKALTMAKKAKSQSH